MGLFYCAEVQQTLYATRCGQCKTEFAMSEAVYTAARQRAGDMAFYCPNGHGRVFVKGETEEDKLRRERDLLKQRLAQKDDEIARQLELREAAERSATARKGQVTRLRNRAAAGVCPCCNRTVSQMAKHMATKHPGFKAEEVA